MDDPSMDFLDVIVHGEERTYQDVYRNAFHEACSAVGDPEHEEDRKECQAAYFEGLYTGMKLISELGALYGLVTELLDRSHEFDSQLLASSQWKRGSAVIKTATDLREMLIQSPGLLKVNDAGAKQPIEIVYKEATFERDMTAIRSKAKLLQHLLDVHVIEEATNQLSF